MSASSSLKVHLRLIVIVDVLDEAVTAVLDIMQSRRVRSDQRPNDGDESSLIAWSAAGYAGLNTKAQSGLFLSWAGAPLLWRSSRQTVSSLSTAEAELGAGALTWQITEGMRSLLEEWGIKLEPIKLLMDNDAAIAITEQGPNWRTRYFNVQASRIQEEILKGRIILGHEPTKTMIADLD